MEMRKWTRGEGKRKVDIFDIEDEERHFFGWIFSRTIFNPHCYHCYYAQFVSLVLHPLCCYSFKAEII